MISNEKSDKMSKKDKAVIIAAMNAIRANLAIVDQMLELSER
jgi:hypothetical protein